MPRGQLIQFRLAYIVFELDVDAQRKRALLQQAEQLLARDTAEAVTTRGNRAATEMNIDVIPMREAVGDLLVSERISGGQIFQRRIRKHYAPAERVERTVALVDRELVLGIVFLEQDRKIEAG